MSSLDCTFLQIFFIISLSCFVSIFSTPVSRFCMLPMFFTRIIPAQVAVTARTERFLGGQGGGVQFIHLQDGTSIFFPVKNIRGRNSNNSTEIFFFCTSVVLFKKRRCKWMVLRLEKCFLIRTSQQGPSLWPGSAYCDPFLGSVVISG